MGTRIVAGTLQTRRRRGPGGSCFSSRVRDICALKGQASCSEVPRSVTVACWFWVRGLRLRSRAAGMSQGGTITEILIGQIRWHGSPSGRKQPQGSSGGGPHHSHLWSCPGRGTGQPEGPEGLGAPTPRRGRAELWGLSKCLSLVLETCRAKPPPGASLGERERGAAARLWPVVELSTQALNHEQDLAPEPAAGELCGQEPRPQLEVPETPFPPRPEKALRAFHADTGGLQSGLRSQEGFWEQL